MNTIPYTYQAVRYVHDPAAGEALNVGVVVYARDVAPHVFVRFEHRYERLSAVFASFDGDHYRQTLRSFEAAVDSLRGQWADATTIPGLADLPADAGAMVSRLWPDQGLSYQTGPLMAGITDDPVAALDALFQRLVLSQAPAPRPERRSDEDVWQNYQPRLARHAIVRVLKPKLFQMPDFEIEFPHAFRNERWHALQPLSLDYQRRDTIQAAATRWLGNAVALQANPEMGKLYVLLGQPRLDAHRPAYTKAKNLLHKMPIEHELVEEDEAEEFARELEVEMRRHGLIEDAPVV